MAGSAAVTGALRRITGSRMRVALAWVLGVAGLAAYSWWLLVPLKPGLMTSPDQLFSDLEVTGNPYASVMQHCDLASGLLLLAAFLLAGYWTGGAGTAQPRPGRREWLAMLGFAVGGALGGAFPEVCEDGISAACRRAEWHLQLPASQYIHIVAGIIEFAGITVALFFAWRRTSGAQASAAQASAAQASVAQANVAQANVARADGGPAGAARTLEAGSGGAGAARSRIVAAYRFLAMGAVIAYPLLGLAYLVSRLGGVIEGVFFIGFTVMVVVQLAERTAGLHARLVLGTTERPAGSAPQLPWRGGVAASKPWRSG